MAEYGFLQRSSGFDTKSVHSGHDPSMWPSGDIITPICTSVSYEQSDVGKSKAGYGYSRFGNPTRRALEKALAQLNDAKHCLTFCSGMSTLVTLTHLLQSGDRILVADEVYGGSPKYFTEVASKFGIVTTYFDATDLENLENHVTPQTKLVWVESPTNPMLKVVDIRKLSERVRSLSKEAIVVVDNTFMTSYLQKPLNLGADIAMASLTKYYNGHCDVTMGAVCLNDEDLFNRIHSLQKTMGTIPSPYDCGLAHRSLRTLPLRMEKHMRNAIAVAKYLEQHPKVRKVVHPMLDSFPQKELAHSQSYGHSGMMAFYVDGTLEEVSKFLRSLNVFTLAGSLGDIGSLIAMTVKMVDIPEPKKHDTESYNHQLIRMSVGLEDAEDLIQDLAQALDKAFPREE